MKRQTLLSIKRTTGITTKALAEKANLPVSDVFIVEVGGLTSKKVAVQVLTAFNQLSGRRIRLEDLAIALSS